MPKKHKSLVKRPPMPLGRLLDLKEQHVAYRKSSIPCSNKSTIDRLLAFLRKISQDDSIIRTCPDAPSRPKLCHDCAIAFYPYHLSTFHIYPVKVRQRSHADLEFVPSYLKSRLKKLMWRYCFLCAPMDCRGCIFARYFSQIWMLRFQGLSS